MPRTSINKAVEQTLITFISGSLPSGSATYYSGIGNVDLDIAPACIVDCESTDEIIYNSGIYWCNITIYIKEMMGDVPTSQTGILADTIFNLFEDSGAIAKINAIRTWNFSCCQLVRGGQHEGTTGDASSNNMTMRIVGSLANTNN